MRPLCMSTSVPRPARHVGVEDERRLHWHPTSAEAELLVVRGKLPS
jgi:hypothetical protein